MSFDGSQRDQKASVTDYMESDAPPKNIYKTQIKYKVKVGQYGWCGNSRRFRNGNHLLCTNPTQSVYGKTSKRLICLQIDMNPELFSSIDHIQIINTETLFLTNYTVGRVTNPQIMIFKLPPSNLDVQSIRIEYQKEQPRRHDAHPLSRTPLKTVYSEIIEIIPPAVFNSQTPCVICCNTIRENPYISHCGHMFCMQCILDYSRCISKLHIDNACEHVFRCDHGSTVNPFPCPLCRTVLETEII